MSATKEGFMSSPTSSHPKIIVTEHAHRSSVDSMRRTISSESQESRESRRISTSSDHTPRPHDRQHSHHSHHSNSHSDDDQDDDEDTHHPGTRVHESSMHQAEDDEPTEQELETVTSMEEERRRRKRDYAIQLSRIMGRQLVSGISKGSRAEAKARMREGQSGH